LHPSPLWLPDNWVGIVNTPLQTIDLDAIRRPLKRGRPVKTRNLRIA
jgi:hypothetical protein